MVKIIPKYSLNKLVLNNQAPDFANVIKVINGNAMIPSHSIPVVDLIRSVLYHSHLKFYQDSYIEQVLSKQISPVMRKLLYELSHQDILLGYLLNRTAMVYICVRLPDRLIDVRVHS